LNFLTIAAEAFGYSLSVDEGCQERHTVIREALLRAMLHRNMSDNELVRQHDHIVANVVALPLFFV